MSYNLRILKKSTKQQRDFSSFKLVEKEDRKAPELL